MRKLYNAVSCTVVRRSTDTFMRIEKPDATTDWLEFYKSNWLVLKTQSPLYQQLEHEYGLDIEGKQ